MAPGSMAVHGVCSSDKVGYLDEATAMLVLQNMMILHDDRHKTERSQYCCDECGYWHLTSWRITT